jgi:phosphatidylinositol glycan class P protein
VFQSTLPFRAVIFLAWALLPDHTLHQLGITYYPMKYWAIAFPIWLCVTFVFVITVYWSSNWISTEPLESYYTITDKHARTAAHHHFDDDDEEDGASAEGIPPLTDIPIHVVNRLLYHQTHGTVERKTVAFHGSME